MVLYKLYLNKVIHTHTHTIDIYKTSLLIDSPLGNELMVLAIHDIPSHIQKFKFLSSPSKLSPAPISFSSCYLKTNTIYIHIFKKV